MTRPAALVLAALTVAALAASGCDRKPRFVPAGADSTFAGADSFATQVDQVRAAWDVPEPGAEAAQLTARLLRDALDRSPEQPVPDRLRQQADSLTLGAEIVGSGAVAVANLFSAANPGGGSWPFLFWREGGEARHQQIEGAGLKLVDVSQRGSGSDLPGMIAVLFTRTARSGEQPLVFVWRRGAANRPWTLQQSLGADSLGGVGVARFQPPSADSVILVARTYKPAPRFEECPTCPHLYRNRMFRWSTAGLSSAGEYAEQSPYHAFVHLIRALEVGDRDLAARYLSDASLIDVAMSYEWGAPKGTWRVSPATQERAREMIIFRGTREAYMVHFGTRGPDWVVIGFEPTSRSIE